MTRSPSTPTTSSPTLRWLTRAGGEVCAGAPTASSRPITWRFGNDGTSNPTSQLRIWAQTPSWLHHLYLSLSILHHLHLRSVSHLFPVWDGSGSSWSSRSSALVSGGAADGRWLWGPNQWVALFCSVRIFCWIKKLNVTSCDQHQPANSCTDVCGARRKSYIGVFFFTVLFFRFVN